MTEVGKRLLQAMHSEGLFEDELLAEALAEARAEGPECCDWRHVWPCRNIPRCDEPGCKAEADCGWPSGGGYRRTCGVHMYHSALKEEGR